MESETRIRAFTGTSFKSFADAALQALQQIPAGPEGLRSGRVVEQEVSEGGVVGRPQFRVTLMTATPPSDT